MRVAAVQLCSTPDLEQNLAQATHWIARAVERGATFVALPENAPFLGPDTDKASVAEGLDGPVVGHFAKLAKIHGVHVLVGSVAETGPDPQRTYNTSVLLDPSGQISAVYRKIHLFDVDTPSGQSLRESDGVAPGEEVVLGEVEGVKMGLTVCYDLRFPELYRALIERGAKVLCVPAAFTAETGRDHWLALLKARAIENLAYVVAPNQVGTHFGSRRSYGRSVVIDPWGTVLATAPDRPGVVVAELDFEAQAKTRAHFPCLQHRRQELFVKEFV